MNYKNSFKNEHGNLVVYNGSNKEGLVGDMNSDYGTSLKMVNFHNYGE